MASDVWLLHPVLSADFVNGHHVPMREQRQHFLAMVAKEEKSRGREDPRQRPVWVHLVFQDGASRNKRSDAIQHVFPAGSTEVIPPCINGRGVFLSVFGNNGGGGGGGSLLSVGGRPPKLKYDQDRFDSVGKLLFLLMLNVEMNDHTKQYKRKCKDIMAKLLKVDVEAIVDEDGIAGLNPNDINHLGSLQAPYGGAGSAWKQVRPGLISNGQVVGDEDTYCQAHSR